MSKIPSSTLKRTVPLYKQRGFHLFLLTVPLLVIVFMLSYLPLYGWSFAFFDYRPGRPINADNFVGLKHFTSMFADRYVRADVIRILQNTFGMSLLGILGSPLAMIFAIFLSEITFSPAKRTIQTLTTIPNFISWVLVYAIAYATFSVGDGWVNRIIVSRGGEAVNFLASRDNVWLSMWGYQIWKGLGWGAVIYLAALAGIDQEQYEAARIDGAGRFACMWHITVPGLLPTYFVLLILSIGHFLSTGVEQFFLFQNALNKERIEVLDLFIYNQGMIRTNYSFTTAIGMFKSLVSLVLLFTANRLSKIFRGETVF